MAGAGESNAASDLDRAHQAHAVFVDALWQPAQTEVARVAHRAGELQALAEREASTGVTTGQVGFGPIARTYAEEARTQEAAAARLQVDLERLAPRFETPIEGLTAAEIYSADLAAWQAAPTDWKTEVPAPVRGAYKDLEQEVQLLTPYWKVAKGELPAVAALLLAMLVDGLAVILGSAIHSGGRTMVDRVSEAAADAIGSVRVGQERVRQAWLSDPRMPVADGAMDDALGVVVLRIAGRGSSFLGAVYQAIDPETGAVDFAALQRADDASWRLASRMLLDRLRSPRLGWVMVSDGYWRIPPERYPTVAAWLAGHLRREAEAEELERADHVQVAERTLELVLPAA